MSSKFVRKSGFRLLDALNHDQAPDRMQKQAYVMRYALETVGRDWAELFKFSHVGRHETGFTGSTFSVQSKIPAIASDTNLLTFL